MSPKDPNAIRLRLELEIPQGLAAIAAPVSYKGDVPSPKLELATTPTITLPASNGDNASTKPKGSDRVICAEGTYTGRHVFARVFLGATDPGHEEPVADAIWVRPSNLGTWHIAELPVRQLDQDNLLVVWGDSGTVFSRVSRRFVPRTGTATDCESSGSGSFAATTWADMAPLWKFTLSGVAEFRYPHWQLLNGVWVIRRDERHAASARWHHPLPFGLFDPKSPAYWRLQYCPRSGIWHLDCVSNLDQKLGTFLSYQARANDWNPCGPNEMTLATDSGLCRMPRTILLTPI